MKHLNKKFLEIGLSVGFLGGAIFFINKELHRFNFFEVMQATLALPVMSLGLALFFTGVNYLVLAGYDGLALRFIGEKVPLRSIGFTSFVSYAFGNSLGIFWGNLIRYRLYQTLGLEPEKVAQAMSFVFFTFWLGFLTLLGVSFLVVPTELPTVLQWLPIKTTFLLGVIFSGIVAIFLAWTSLGNRQINWKKSVWKLPGLRFNILQISLVILDWVLAAGVLYVLLPDTVSISYGGFLSVFLLTQFVAIISQVPGGIGVFEALIILMLPTTKTDSSALLAALLIYRAIYYLLPLLAAFIVYSAHEIHKNKIQVMNAIHVTSKIVPVFLSMAVFLSGLMLILTGTLPSEGGRMHLLKDILPLPAIELSHFLASLVGVGLLILAQAIKNRVNVAYYLTIGLLFFGIIFSLIKSLDYEQAFLMTLLLVVFLPAKKYFHRNTSLFNANFNVGWFLSVGFSLALATTLGLFLYQHVEYQNDLWWQFTWNGDASRFLRSQIGGVVLLLFFFLVRLFQIQPQKLEPPGSIDLAKVEQIISHTEQTMANLAYLGDKYFYFNQAGTSFIMFGVRGRSLIALGDPIGPMKDLSEMVQSFRAFSKKNGYKAAFYQVTSATLPAYLDNGMSLIKLGEEALIPLSEFSLEGKKRQDFRSARNKLEAQGFRFEIMPKESVKEWIPLLRNVSNQWLEGKQAKEKGFSLGKFETHYIERFPIACVRNEKDEIIAFSNLWLGSNKQELSIDLMRFDPQISPNGTMEYLFSQILLWGKSEGYAYFNLGMAPLSGMMEGENAPLWHKFANLTFDHGNKFYNFEGLRAYKEKFSPQWESRYLATEKRMSVPGVLSDATILISGGLSGIFKK